MKKHTLGIDIGSTTVKIAILDENDTLIFSDYRDILQISRKPLQIFFRKLRISLVN